ncbi:hypothetical protein SAMN05444280_14418 [Tangfeifania diversioriginum]|uniref:O-Antigen ligase n=1 Tax=Tangfeifania diversioriginum TaxID=1168035 RepID=A0A1M6NNF7_9BACT|nr:hypothetical protein [Tangfeifania diversioriginum]SHJ97279.1 hypothetical protein SAMN05444280_14418 [Tangfeifania diversioriginum]
MKKVKLNITDYSILLAVASTSLYIVFRILGRELGSFAYLWAPLALITIILTRPSIFKKKLLIKVIFYGIFMVGILQFFLWNYLDDWNKGKIFGEFYNIFIMISILYYYKEKKEYHKLALIAKYAFIFILIGIIGTNIALSLDSMIVRQSASSGKFTSYQVMVYKYTGAMGYNYIQAMVCLIPILIFYIKNKQKMIFKTKTLIVVLLLLLITLIRSQVFANVLIAIFITILSLLDAKKFRKSVVIVLFFGFLFYLIPNSYYIDAIYYLGEKFEPGTAMHYKINDFAFFLKNPEIDIETGAGARAERYPMLFEALAANPLFGNSSYNSPYDIGLGAHLYWMNRLTLWGIPGFIFFVYILISIFKKISSLFDEHYRFYYFLSILAFVLLGLIKATGGREIWFMLIVVIPGLYFLPLLLKKEENSSFTD